MCLKDWDLLFTRYSAPVDDGAGGFFDLVTSGVLSAPGIEVAEARGVDPFYVEYTDYVTRSVRISMLSVGIGKSSIMFHGHSATDRAYFVKDRTARFENHLF
ncbi:MAG: hypothetical protein R2825_23780 [Saprospiraceae bacterium]